MKTFEPKFSSLAVGSASLAVLGIALVSTNLIQGDTVGGTLAGLKKLPLGVTEHDGQQDTAEVVIDEQQIQFEPLTASPRAPAVVRESERMAQKLMAPGLDTAVDRRQRTTAMDGYANSAPLSVVESEEHEPLQQVYQDQGRDQFSDIVPNPVKKTTEEPVSTFSADVDTASYSYIRATLNRGTLPQMDAVRIEELINYFNFNYEIPSKREQPFASNLAIMPSPWNAANKLLRIGIKGYEIPRIEAPSANLVFLIDTSGSMEAPDKLPLLRNSFKMLLETLDPDDVISIVTYAGSAGIVLEPTRASNKAAIFSALDNLNAGGGTAGGEGIRRAYQLAESHMKDDGVNRVILATDGDFNVGISDDQELKSFVERKRENGVTLSVLGFGHGNYNDELMQTLAQNGNGNAAYIDNLNEARKVLVEQASSTLFTIAKDIKFQLEFNAGMVGEYRLIGYETRILNREDFNNDKVDAGDIGAGHSVTALYEFTPIGEEGLLDDLRYGSQPSSAEPAKINEYGFLKIRYKMPDSNVSELITAPIDDQSMYETIADAPDSARFAAAVAGFGQILRGGKYTGDYGYDDVIALAQSAKGEDPFGYRAEFISLVRLAKSAAALEPLKK